MNSARPSLAETRERFAQGDMLPAGMLGAVLQRSWERTRAAGLRPRDHALFHHQVSDEQRRRVHDRHRPLIELATPDMEQLLRTMNSPNWMVLLTNTQGTIVHSLGDHALAPRRLRLPLGCGRSLLESEIGSNAPVIAGQEAQEVLLCGEDHYLDELSTFSCAAAPVMGFDGQVTAVLDVTGIDVQADARTLARVRRAARSIEGRIYEQHHEATLIQLHEDARFIGTPEQGLLLVREDGSLLGANTLARRMLDLPVTLTPQSLPTLQELFDGRSIASLRRSSPLVIGGGESRQVCQVRTHDGAPLQVTIRHQGASASRTPARRAVVSLPTSSSNSVSQADPAWQQAFERASRVYPHGMAVLIQGETGTGKEWFARALHEAHRPGKPFIAVNCAALAESMAEAELFGHTEGAFTGSRRGGAAGRLEQANGGTLFLDEIGDMPPHLQTRLLRVVQERRVLRIGGDREVPLDLLVLSASHHNLSALVEAGTFRQDLYYRLNSLTVQLPALREREDLDLLIDQCLGSSSRHLPDSLRARMLAYNWPGNLRQMAQALRVAALLAESQSDITQEMLPPELFAAPVSAAPVASSSTASLDDIQAVRYRAATEALTRNGSNISAAARALGVSRTTFYRYLRSTP